MTIIFNQPFGLGDVIFSQTLAHKYLQKGHNVLWPVFSQFVEGLTRAYPKIEFRDWREVKINYERRDYHLDRDRYVIPLRWAREILKVPYSDCMRAKYQLFNRSVYDWREHAMWTRGEAREQALFDALGLKKGQPYNLVNRTFRSDFSGKVTVRPGDDYPCIELTHYEGFSLFDWGKVIECAAEIHTVSTALLYMLEMLPLVQPIHLYKRLPDETHFDNVSYLFTKPYQLH